MNYQPHDFQTAKHNIIEYLYGDITPVPHPKAHLVCAQPGAGKTGLISQFAGNAAFINGDEYRRYYPGYRKRYEEIGNLIIDETKDFAAKMTEALIDELSRKSLNLIVEGTLRTVEVPEKTRRILEARGYEVELDVLMVKPEISYLRTLKRYAEMKEAGTVPRMTSKDHHDLVVRGLVQNLSYLYTHHSFKEIKLFKEEQEQMKQVYSYREKTAVNPADRLKSEFERKMSEEEINQMIHDYGPYAGKEIYKILGI